MRLPQLLALALASTDSVRWHAARLPGFAQLIGLLELQAPFGGLDYDFAALFELFGGLELRTRSAAD